MKTDIKYTTPDGDEICAKSAMLGPDGAKWNVSRIEEWPVGSGITKVILMGDGNCHSGINLNDMVGWKVIEYDDHS